MASTTLRELTGQVSEPSAIQNAVLILIDCQNTYTEGVMKLEGVTEALEECHRLLKAFRASKRPIVHIIHDAGPGTPYDVTAPIGKIVDLVAPQEGEATVTKKVPSSFTNTNLDEILKTLGCQELVLAGFMTHMCVSSTARSAFELGYRCTVVGGATATRNLPAASGGGGGADDKVVDAKTLKKAALCAIADMFAVVVDTVDDLENKK